MLPTHATFNNRRSPNLVISIPGTPQQTPFRPHFKPTGRIFFRYLPWVVGCTIVLWLFVLRADNPPSRPPPRPLGGGVHHHPVPGGKAGGGLPYATHWGGVPHPADSGDQGTESSLKWWPGGSKNGKSTETRPKKPLTVWDERAEKVKNAFAHALEGYLQNANGYDELLPVVGGKVNNFNGWGVTLFDSLDTMWIMGLHDKFQESLGVVAKTRFHLNDGDFAPFFETIIRYLGGLLSAYALSGEPILLTRADDLGRMLLPAFDTPSGFPMFAINTVNGRTKSGWAGGVLWSEALSNQMEYKYLAHLTGRQEYFNKTERIMKRMSEISLNKGLFPTIWDLSSGTPSNTQYSVGAYADSAYEYLLKQWLLTGRSEPRALELYLNATDGILSHLLHLTPRRQLLYVTDTQSDALTPSHTLEHLSCFLPGLLALGAHTVPADMLSAKDRGRHLWAAQGLAETCWTTYADTKTGLGPDEVIMEPWNPAPSSTTTPDTTTASTGEDAHLTDTATQTTTKQEKRTEKRGFWDNIGGGNDDDVDVGGRWMAHVEKWERGGRKGGRPPGTKEVLRETDPAKRDWRSKKDSYLLRPETIESFYVLWRTTGEVKWRDRGWSIFEAIEKHARTKFGYASVQSVDHIPPHWKDEMPSYFLAETLKYLYLLFSDEDLIPLENWVFNTEAHPLPIFEWAPWEKQEYGIGNLSDPPSTATGTIKP